MLAAWESNRLTTTPLSAKRSTAKPGCIAPPRKSRMRRSTQLVGPLLPVAWRRTRLSPHDPLGTRFQRGAPVASVSHSTNSSPRSTKPVATKKSFRCSVRKRCNLLVAAARQTVKADAVVDAQGIAAHKPWPLIFRAKTVVTMAGPVIENGAVAITGDRISAVGSSRELQSLGGNMANLGDVALLPGLINAHCHLDFTILARPARRRNLPSRIGLCKSTAPGASSLRRIFSGR